MSAKAIREYHGKRLVSKWISEYGDYDIENRCVQVGDDICVIAHPCKSGILAVEAVICSISFCVRARCLVAVCPGSLNLVIVNGNHLSVVCVLCLSSRQVKAEMLQGGAEAGFAKIEQDNPWLASTPLVVKPDQLIKRRGKAGLLAVNKTWPEVQAWISERMGKSQEVSQMK